MISKQDWSKYRQQMMLDPTIINLNTGSFGPLPQVVFDQATRERRDLAAEPTHYFVRLLPPRLWEARCRVAAFLGTTPQQFIFTANVSVAINIIASGLHLPAGEILLTDHEYGAMHWCWQRAAARQGLVFKTFALPTKTEDPEEIVRAAVQAMTPQTRLFFFSHILSPTGLVLPAQRLVAEARRRGIITVVDGAHAPAMIDLNLAEVDADFYCGNAHKWLLAPSGAGFLAWRGTLGDRLEPMQVSWGYHKSGRPLDEPDEFGSTPRTRYLEFEGTRDPAPWLSIPTAIDFQSGIGWSNIRQRMRELSDHARQKLTALGLTEATPRNPQLRGSLTAFELPLQGKKQAQVLRDEIWKHRIEIPIVERPDRLLIRVSGHFYNQEEEIDALAAILPSAIAVASQS